jgi:hypothetical protein
MQRLSNIFRNDFCLVNPSAIHATTLTQLPHFDHLPVRKGADLLGSLGRRENVVLKVRPGFGKTLMGSLDDDRFAVVSLRNPVR